MFKGTFTLCIVNSKDSGILLCNITTAWHENSFKPTARDLTSIMSLPLQATRALLRKAARGPSSRHMAVTPRLTDYFGSKERVMYPDGGEDEVVKFRKRKLTPVRYGKQSPSPT